MTTKQYGKILILPKQNKISTVQLLCYVGVSVIVAQALSDIYGDALYEYMAFIASMFYNVSRLEGHYYDCR